MKQEDKIPTADDIFAKYIRGTSKFATNEKRAMIEFAKLHVKAALEAASEKARAGSWGLGAGSIDKDSILNAYPQENIK